MKNQTDVITRLLSEDAAAPYFECSDPTDNYLDGGNMVMRGLHNGIPFNMTALGVSGQYALTTHG